MTLPNFLLLGAAKAGTSSVWHYLKQHPQIFMSNPKEPNFFVFEGANLTQCEGPAPSKVLYQHQYGNTITEWESYEALFQGVSEELAIGEASVRYLYYPQAPEAIKKRLPDVKMIAILRNPVDRLYSHYAMNVQSLLEPLPLEEALKQEEERIRNDWGWDWHYTRVGMYAQQIERYLNYFQPEQLKILFYEQLCQEPMAMMKEIYDFLGVDNSFVPDMEKRMLQGYLPKNKTIQQFLYTSNRAKSFLEKSLPRSVYQASIQRLKRWNRKQMPPLSCTLRSHLNDVFREDSAGLAKILNTELSWMKRME